MFILLNDFCMNIMKTSYSLQRLRVMVMFYVLETWLAIIIINNKWHSEKKKTQKHIVCAAAKLIQAEIKERTYDANHIPQMKILLM